MPKRKNADPGVYSYRLKSGAVRWGAVWYASTDWETGKRRQQRKQGFRTKDEAVAWRVKHMYSRHVGTDMTEPSKQPLAAYLDSWVESLVDLAPNTRINCRNNLVPAKRELGNTPLNRLTPTMIESFNAHRLRRGDTRSGVYNTYRVLKRALRKATLLGLIPVNPCDRVKPPREPKHEPAEWTAEHLQTFIRVNADHPVWGTLWILLAETWMRIGEAADLRWADVDLEAGSITISHAVARNDHLILESGPTKTENSRRTLLISDHLLAALRARREAHAGDPPDALIFPAPRSGGFLKSQAVAHALERACVLAGVPILSPHELRHNGSSIAYMDVMDVLTISERLGHSSVSFTMSKYVHLNRRHHRAAATQMGALLFPDKDPETEK